jgi:hypothetical protein
VKGEPNKQSRFRASRAHDVLPNRSADSTTATCWQWTLRRRKAPTCQPVSSRAVQGAGCRRGARVAAGSHDDIGITVEAGGAIASFALPDPSSKTSAPHPPPSCSASARHRRSRGAARPRSAGVAGAAQAEGGCSSLNWTRSNHCPWPALRVQTPECNDGDRPPAAGHLGGRPGEWQTQPRASCVRRAQRVAGELACQRSTTRCRKMFMGHRGQKARLLRQVDFHEPRGLPYEPLEHSSTDLAAPPRCGRRFSHLSIT